MRRLAVLAVLLGLLCAFPLPAQQPSMSSFLTGVNPHSLNFTKLDTSRAIRPSSGSAFRSPSAPRYFNLVKFFPRLSNQWGWPPTIGTSKFPTMKVQSK